VAKQVSLLITIILFSFSALAEKDHRAKDSTNIYQKVDTNYIRSFKDLLSVKLYGVVRTNKFSVTEKKTNEKIEFSTNTKLNVGLGITFKGIGIDLEYTNRTLNNDDLKYGKSTQFSISTSANARKFIYDAYYRTNKGYHTAAQYKIGTDTIKDYYKREDIQNYNAGLTLTYVFNHRKYSSAAPYSLGQKQLKSAGSMLLGTYAFLYAITADTIIYPDTLYKKFPHEVQMNSMASITYGISCGYNYTFVLWKNWFVNITTLPGISVQQFYAINAFDKTIYNRFAGGLSLQSRFALGYNKKDNYFGISWMNNIFSVDDNTFSSVQYRYGTFKFYYGHRFDIRKLLKKKL
jgi:hypothetical protein